MLVMAVMQTCCYCNFLCEDGYVICLQACRRHQMVQRSDLTDFLIAPMQHQCHYQLLLEVEYITQQCACVLIKLPIQNVLKATSDPTEKSLLTSAIKAFAVALSKTLLFPIPYIHSVYLVCTPLEELQANITAHQRSVELLELQETLSWPSLASLCPDSYIPEVTELTPLHHSAL